MKYITFDETRPMDLVLLGRIAVDFNPVDYFQPLEDCTTFKKYVGGSRQTSLWAYPDTA